ncbi:MAG: hypothetical protein IT495_19215 [Gammaproteobacteria bacterium]|nr:hypothetical protein [Gammaproteobacteria bacterium]
MFHMQVRVAADHPALGPLAARGETSRAAALREIGITAGRWLGVVGGPGGDGGLMERVATKPAVCDTAAMRARVRALAIVEVQIALPPDRYTVTVYPDGTTRAPRRLPRR